MGKADFHMHTSLNDGTATVREMLNYVRDRTDLDVISITDHDRLTGSYQALELANEYKFEILPGAEIFRRMIERVNAPLPREAEPALTFDVEQG